MRDIDIRKLKEVINILLDHVIDMGVDSLPLEQSFYWKIHDDEKYAMSGTPDLVVGDLFDDLDFVEGVLLDKDNVVSYTLTEVAPILTYVGEVAFSKLGSKGG
ncbi:hypothetical protein [Dyella tabacisoli]|uniref:hypothetical protein n=1 Tax=Dyella tabacisoli TaxID=2282381 RepID=UPI000E0A1DB1|nr:hypothetical protein [Dyella tabacisoli]